MKPIRLILAALALAVSTLASAGTIHMPDAFLASYLQGGGNLSTGVVKCALIDITSYNRATDVYLADVTQVTGTNYVAGGQVSTVTVAADTTNHWTTVTINPVVVASSTTTISATGAACYDSTSSNRLIAVDDFGATVASSGGTYTVGAIVLKFTHF